MVVAVCDCSLLEISVPVLLPWWALRQRCGIFQPFFTYSQWYASYLGTRYKCYHDRGVDYLIPFSLAWSSWGPPSAFSCCANTSIGCLVTFRCMKQACSLRAQCQCLGCIVETLFAVWSRPIAFVHDAHIWGALSRHFSLYKAGL